MSYLRSLIIDEIIIITILYSIHTGHPENAKLIAFKIKGWLLVIREVFNDHVLENSNLRVLSPLTDNNQKYKILDKRSSNSMLANAVI